MISSVSYIYTLSCPVTGDIKYIGKANNIAARLRSHIYESCRLERPVCKWVARIVSDGLVPVATQIAECHGDEWISEEKRLISEYRNAGYELLNIASGGDQPYQTVEQRQIKAGDTASKIHKDPELRMLWDLKTNAGQMLVWLEKNGAREKAENLKAAMRYAAAKRPQIFGKWAAV